jgi:hypothetical protein
MQPRLIILAATIASLAFGSTTVFAHGSHGGMHAGMAMHGGHFGAFHHHGTFFVGTGYVAYPYDGYYYDDEESCPLVRRRVRTDHGLRWRTVRACAY